MDTEKSKLLNQKHKANKFHSINKIYPTSNKLDNLNSTLFPIRVVKIGFEEILNHFIFVIETKLYLNYPYIIIPKYNNLNLTEIIEFFE